MSLTPIALGAVQTKQATNFLAERPEYAGSFPNSQADIGTTFTSNVVPDLQDIRLRHAIGTDQSVLPQAYEWIGQYCTNVAADIVVDVASNMHDSIWFAWLEPDLASIRSWNFSRLEAFVYPKIAWKPSDP